MSLFINYFYKIQSYLYIFYFNIVSKPPPQRAPQKIGGIGNRGDPGKIDELSSQVLTFLRDFTSTVNLIHKNPNFDTGNGIEDDY